MDFGPVITRFIAAFTRAMFGVLEAARVRAGVRLAYAPVRDELSSRCTGLTAHGSTFSTRAMGAQAPPENTSLLSSRR
ncbi:MAG: hypothetical protein ACREJQ_07705 [bacterium]